MKVKKFVDLSQPFGHNTPLWPYFPDIKIERPASRSGGSAGTDRW